MLISNSTNAGEKYLDWCKEMIGGFCAESGVKRVLFIPYAGVSMGYDNYEAKVKEVFARLGLELYSIHKEKDPVEAVRKAECIAVGGGNTFHLVYEMYRNGIMGEVAQRAKAGVPYMGWSAGSNVAGLSLKTTNDMPIIEPESFDCLALVPFQINPHYTDFFDPKHGGETRDDRLIEFTKVNPTVPVAAIREATALRLKDGKLKLIGRNNKMKLFLGDYTPEEYDLNGDINFLMQGYKA